ncbi:MAG: hypothetical protein U1F59_13680 [Candidatus Competibacteraceae bacterium]
MIRSFPLISRKISKRVDSSNNGTDIKNERNFNSLYVSSYTLLQSVCKKIRHPGWIARGMDCSKKTIILIRDNDLGAMRGGKSPGGTVKNHDSRQGNI